MLIAAALAFVFGVITVFSIGIFLFAFCVLQLVAVVLLRRNT
jgi:hypothetical protein